ncbi:unnamed protein product, partial [marine sediment metagenome]
MREIKFRAWDRGRECMVSSSGSRTESYGFRYPWGFQTGYNKIDIMQFTGLKGKNGVEIFEGDIVEGKYIHDSKVIGVVEYNSMAFGFVGKKPDGSRWFDTITTPGYTQDDDIEVIGNIHENPE